MASLTGTSADYVWRIWTADTWTSTTTACSSNDTVWNTWANGSTTNTSSSITVNPNTVWFTWVSDSTDTTNDGTIHYEARPTRIITPEENERLNRLEQERQERVERERQERDERIRIQREAKDKAEIKAKELLLDIIGKEQLAVYEKTGNLFVKGKKNNYIIRKHGRIIRFNKETMGELCFHLTNRYGFPDTDNVVAVKLALEAMEDWVLKEANQSCLQEFIPSHIPEAACAPPLN